MAYRAIDAGDRKESELADVPQRRRQRGRIQREYGRCWIISINNYIDYSLENFQSIFKLIASQKP